MSNSFARRLTGWLWLTGLTVLPCLIDPLRVEAFESPRATLSIVLSLVIGLAAFIIFRRLSPSTRLDHLLDYLRQPLTLAVILWAASIVISAALSLSPSRSILGDLQRRMGALTQLSMLAAFAVGRWSPGSSTDRYRSCWQRWA